MQGLEKQENRGGGIKGMRGGKRLEDGEKKRCDCWNVKHSHLHLQAA